MVHKEKLGRFEAKDLNMFSQLHLFTKEWINSEPGFLWRFRLKQLSQTLLKSLPRVYRFWFFKIIKVKYKDQPSLKYHYWYGKDVLEANFFLSKMEIQRIFYHHFFTSITTVHGRKAQSTFARELSMFFLSTAFNQIINQFLVTFPVKITVTLDSRILNWVVYTTP